MPPTKDQLRITELEGLLDQQTRKLEQTERELADAEREIERLEDDGPHLEEAKCAPYLERVEQAIERLSALLRDDVTDHDDLWIGSDEGEPRVLMIVRAVQTLSVAHVNLTPKPLPAGR